MIYTCNGDINNAEFRKGFLSALMFLNEQYNGHFGTCKMTKKNMINILNISLHHVQEILDKEHELLYMPDKNEFIFSFGGWRKYD